jgi:polyvinyl alcohol dehydrogenase (cytochrome)
MTATGPGSALGGILWGTATDGSRIYVANGNGNHATVTLRSATGGMSTTTGGYWSALDAATGRTLWQTADPQPAYLDIGMLSGADGVIYAGSTAPSGDNMYALDSATGVILWRFASGGAVVGGAAVVAGSVYWGSGYHTAGLGLGYPGANDELYAFSVSAGAARP